MLQIKKSAGFQVVADLITIVESVSKYELAIIKKKAIRLVKPMTKKIVYVHYRYFIY